MLRDEFIEAVCVFLVHVPQLVGITVREPAFPHPSRACVYLALLRRNPFIEQVQSHEPRAIGAAEHSRDPACKRARRDPVASPS